jgi:hypothetical protein
MLEVLQFIFSGFWTFAGTALLLAIAASAFSGLFTFNVRSGKKDNAS